jgi:hypothetical protein
MLRLQIACHHSAKVNLSKSLAHSSKTHSGGSDTVRRAGGGARVGLGGGRALACRAAALSGARAARLDSCLVRDLAISPMHQPTCPGPFYNGRGIPLGISAHDKQVSG